MIVRNLLSFVKINVVLLLTFPRFSEKHNNHSFPPCTHIKSMYFTSFKLSCNAFALVRGRESICFPWDQLCFPKITMWFFARFGRLFVCEHVVGGVGHAARGPRTCYIDPGAPLHAASNHLSKEKLRSQTSLNTHFLCVCFCRLHSTARKRARCVELYEKLIIIRLFLYYNWSFVVNFRKKRSSHKV